MEHLHRYDRLGLDAELESFTREVADGHAIELQTIAPALRSIAQDAEPDATGANAGARAAGDGSRGDAIGRNGAAAMCCELLILRLGEAGRARGRARPAAPAPAIRRGPAVESLRATPRAARPPNSRARPRGPAARRLLASVFRFCAKHRRRNASKPAASTPSSPKRGANSSRSTVEKTSGGGEKAAGGSVKSVSTRAFICVVAESSPYSRQPGAALNRSATSRCIITTARASRPLARPQTAASGSAK